MQSILLITTTIMLGQVEWLDQDLFKSHIAELCSHGSRYWDKQANVTALDYIESELSSYGYEVMEDNYAFWRGRTLSYSTNIYVTRWGSVYPDEAYVVGAHMDSYISSTGADDNASGVSLILELARVFSYLDPEISIRFVLFNTEELGLVGSSRYIDHRFNFRYEPIWLGMISYDMILYDRSEFPDANIEYDDMNGMIFGIEFQELMSDELPTELSPEMCCTDSVSFQEFTPSISIRENKRRKEIGNGSNPHYHASTDVPESYSEEDYLFGFKIVQMSLNAMIKLTKSVPRFNLDTWPDFINCMSEGCLEFDLNGDGKIDLKDVSIFHAHFIN